MPEFLLVEAADGERWIGTSEGDDRIVTLDTGNCGRQYDALLVASPRLLAEVKELLANMEVLGDGYMKVHTQDIEALETLVQDIESRS